MRAQRGDTVVEVILAFTIFALIAVSTLYLMNRSLSLGQRSLEITLVRQQVDSQAELLRYARDNQLAGVWDAIKNSAVTTPQNDTSYDVCPTVAPTGSFVMNLQNNGGEAEVSRVALIGPAYTPASYVSRVQFGSNPQAEGLWVVPVEVEHERAYDMYIRACWDSVGSDRPQTVSTIVRLYAT